MPLSHGLACELIETVVQPPTTTPAVIGASALAPTVPADRYSLPPTIRSIGCVVSMIVFVPRQTFPTV